MHHQLLFVLPEMTAQEGAVFITSGDEYLAVCRERHTPNPTTMVRITLQLDVSLLCSNTIRTHLRDDENII